MTLQTVLAALKGVVDPDLGVDIVTLKFVKDKDITIDGDRVTLRGWAGSDPTTRIGLGTVTGTIIPSIGAAPQSRKAS